MAVACFNFSPADDGKIEAGKKRAVLIDKDALTSKHPQLPAERGISY
jgi:hypothetical protein